MKKRESEKREVRDYDGVAGTFEPTSAHAFVAVDDFPDEPVTGFYESAWLQPGPDDLTEWEEHALVDKYRAQHGEAQRRLRTGHRRVRSRKKTPANGVTYWRLF